MTFARFGPLGVLLGFAVLAGVLYLLHRLRVRHREHEVVTTLFWREAVEDVRARVLVRRFRHPWAYVLMCAIAAALWLGIAGPSLNAGDARDHVVLLDASVAMGRGERFAEARAVVEDLAASLPRARTRVVLCGAVPFVLLLPGEDEVLLAARMHEAAPDLCLPTTSAVARSVVDGPRDGPVTVHVVGDLPDDVPERADAVMSWVRIPLPDTRNAGITEIGVTPARSGRSDRVDVFVETRSESGDAPTAVLSPEGESRLAVPAPDTSTRRVLALGVPAATEFVSVQLGDRDAFIPDDIAGASLPVPVRIRVRVAEELLPLLAPVIEAAPDLVLADDRADVVVTGGAAAEDTPSLRVVSPDDGEAVHAIHTGEAPASSVLEDVVTALALDAIDATGLARRTGRIVSVGVEEGEHRELAVWDDFVQADGALHGARTFPVFVTGALRWLAGVSPAPAFVAVGERVPELRRAMTDSSGARHDSLGAAFTPVRADFYTDDDGARVIATLVSPDVTIGGGARQAGATTVPAGGRTTGLVTLLGVLAFLLLAAEWVVHRTGRMP